MTDEQRKRAHAIITYMTTDPSYQKIMPKKACDAIERGYVITFVKVADGSEVSKCTYVPKAYADELKELVRDYDKCLDTALYLAGNAGYPCMPDSGLFSSLHQRMRELGIEV